jgi:hypothetical protein
MITLTLLSRFCLAGAAHFVLKPGVSASQKFRLNIRISNKSYCYPIAIRSLDPKGSPHQQGIYP